MHSPSTPTAKHSIWWSVFMISLMMWALVFPQGSMAQPTMKEVLEQESADDLEDEPIPEDSLGKVPDDLLNRGIPRGAVRGFLSALSDRDFERAANFLDLSNLPRGYTKDQGPHLARHFMVVIDRTLWIDLDQVSNKPEGKEGDGLPPYRDRVGQIKTEQKSYDVLIQRVPREDGVLIWKFSASTVANIPVLYAQFGYGALGEILPPGFFDVEILGIPFAFWVVAFCLLGIYYFLFMGLLKGLLFVLRSKGIFLTPKFQRLLTRPLLLLGVGYAARATLIALLGSTVVVQAVIRANTLILILWAWAIISAIDVLVDHLSQRMKQKGQTAGMVLVPPLINGIRILVVITLLLLWLDNVGFQVTTLIAGLGIGGLAVALAAQKPIENFFSGVILYSAQPVRIGDFCRFGTTLGTVEEINLRATRIRTLEHSLISIPNSDFINSHLENISQREKIWYHPRLRIQYESTADQIRFILVEIRTLLYAHPKVLPDPARVRFVNFGECSFDLDIFAYIATTDYNQYLEVVEDLNLRIIEIVKAAGGRFALPGSESHSEQVKDVDPQRVRDIEAKVEAWRENNTLYLPNFPQERINELRGTLDFPPFGSPQAGSSI